MPTQILGLEEIQRKLASLPDKMQQNVLRAGNRAVATQLVKEVRGRGASLPSTVTKAITAQPNPRSMKTKGFIVGLRSPFSRMSHWFEFGTGPRVQKTTGRETGQMKATPYLRPGLESLRGNVEVVWGKAASRNLELQLRKMAQ